MKLMSELSVRNLIGIKDLKASDLNLIFETTDRFLEVLNRPIKKVPTLRDITIANLFFENSTRTKLSFELAQKRLSADVINFSSSISSIKKGESLVDTINNIISMKVDMIVVRHPSEGVASMISKKVKSIIINAGDGSNEHPTQAILDTFTIQQKFGHITGKKIVIIGDILHSRVALSNIYALKKLGAEVCVCGPTTLIPKYIKSLGVAVETNLKKALLWCDVANVLRVQFERMKSSYFPSNREYSKYYGITKKILDDLGKDITIMHPGPINRGVELSSEVVESDYSVILDQVENGVAVRMAIIYLLASKL